MNYQLRTEIWKGYSKWNHTLLEGSFCKQQWLEALCISQAQAFQRLAPGQKARNS